MYYDTPNMTIYLKKVVKRRVPIILATLLTVAASLLVIKPDIVSSDTQFWLTDSKELERTVAVPLEPHYTTKVNVYLGDTLFFHNKLEELKVFDELLKKQSGVLSVHSLFSENHVFKEKAGEGSELLKVVNLAELPLEEQKEVLQAFYPQYEQFISPDYRRVYFYVNSDTPLELGALPFTFDVEVVQEALMDYMDYVGVYTIIMVMLMVMLGLVFRSILAPLAAFFIVAFTLILTIAVIQLVLPGVHIHIAMTLITISISLLDFLYIYYRWHVNKHTGSNNLTAINIAISKNVKPAMWTTVTTLLGIGTLIFIDSEIIRLLCLSAVLASVIAYVLNFTFLPAFMSYFRAKTKEVVFAKFSRFLANREIHYKKSYLYMFLLLTLTVGVISFYEIFSFPSKLFVNKDRNDIIKLEIPYEEIGLEEMRMQKRLAEELGSRFDGVSSIQSLYSTIMLMKHMEGEKGDALELGDVDRYLFLLELYRTEGEVLGEGTLKMTITLKANSTKKAEMILWIRDFAKQQGIDLYFIDIDSILSIAKHDNTVILSTSLLFALVLIGLIMGSIIKDMFMVFVAFMTNAIPIIWFTLTMLVMQVPISLEILIAMTITVGLASDATIHFVYKYYISRHFKHTKKEALESVFFYAGIPVVIGSLYLAFTFMTLILSGITTLELIGQYAGILILMSLLTDLFILPVLLLFTDHFATDYRAKKKAKRKAKR